MIIPPTPPLEIHRREERHVREEQEEAITAQAAGATIEDIDKGIVNGQTVYEAAFKKDGKTYELQVKEDGTVLGGHFD